MRSNRRIEIFSQRILAKERAVTAAMLEAFRNNRRGKAKEFFELVCEYNEFSELCRQWHQNLSAESNCIQLSLDVWFLQDLIKHLTPHADEEVVYITGHSVGNLRIPYRICEVELKEQSVVYARCTARSCSDALIEINEKGCCLQLVAHSHPGMGKDTTTPSGIDLNYLDKIQKNDSQAVGVIVSRDGFVRFFTSCVEFEVSIKGAEAEYVGDNVFKILLS
ncbi:MAG: hypothetical protein PHH77_04385 [Victivallaceae bacterium]|nr:hypothetical protein [Victivallaceae bacterium]